MDTKKIQQLRSGRLHPANLSTIETMELLARWLETDSLYRLSDGAFEELASQGKIPADPRSDLEVVQAILDGTKPAGFIGEVPEAEGEQGAVRFAAKSGLHLRYLSRVESLDGQGFGRYFLVAADDAALAAIRRADFMVPDPVNALLSGRALGYSEADIANYLQQNYGGRLYGRDLLRTLHDDFNFRFSAHINGEVLCGYEKYRELTPVEWNSAIFPPPTPNTLTINDIAVELTLNKHELGRWPTPVAGRPIAPISAAPHLESQRSLGATPPRRDHRLDLGGGMF